MANKKKEPELLKIIKRYTEGKATAEEIDFLNLYYEGFENQPELLESKSEEERTAIAEDMRVKIMDRTVFNDKERGKIISIASKNWIKVAAAASVILLAFVGIYFLKPTHSKEIAKNIAPIKQSKNDIAPGGNKAILTLANGSTIILDSTQNGTITSQGNIKIIKLNDGQLAYDNSGSPINSDVLYNSISTPKGGQYQLTLSDGSKVWLNAASSLRFPAAFSGSERKVELTGEGYFEVAKNKEKPFIVSANNTSIEVLGTHFNINAYSNENSIKTTLLEGSVKVSKGRVSKIIVPGEQARVNNLSDEISIRKDVDLDEAVAWKNGKFIFQSEDIKSIMRQLERWYNVEVVYDKTVPDEEFVGSISRQVNISQILDMLKKAGSVDFEIKGRTVIVK